MRIYPITPMGKPRMVASDKWKKRPAVMAYWAFKAECRLRGVQLQTGSHVHFIIPMPESWSAKKKARMDKTSHEGKPDIDNLLKSLMDALFDDDAGIWDIRGTKWWGYVPAICTEFDGKLPTFPLGR